MKNYSLPKDKIKILLLEGLHQSAVQTFKNQGYSNIEYLKTSLSEEELIEKIKDVHFIGISFMILKTSWFLATQYKSIYQLY